MKSILISSKLQVKPSPIHGYGVFAADTIADAAIIEECPALLFKKHGYPFNSYYFAMRQHCALALGYGSLYNHSDNPNAYMEFDTERSLLVFKANRQIQAGEEICISYGKRWFDTRHLTIRTPSWRYRVMQYIKNMPVFMRFLVVVIVVAGFYLV